MGWFMLVTLPGGLLAFLSWLILLILHLSSSIEWLGKSDSLPDVLLRFLSRSRQHERYNDS